MFLTYSAIAAMYIPEMLEMLQKGPDHQGAPAQVADADKPAQAGQAKLDHGKKDEAPAAQAAVKPPGARPERPSPGGLLIAVAIFLALFTGLAYSIPVLVAIQAPISGLIFGFALWEAWKINRRVQLAFSGPFRLSAPGAPVLDSDSKEAADGL